MDNRRQPATPKPFSQKKYDDNNRGNSPNNYGNPQARDDNQRFQPRETNQRFQRDDNQRFQPREQRGRFQPRDNNDRYQPRDNREGGYQPRDNNDRYQPRDNTNRFQPRDNNDNRYQPRDNRENDNRYPPRDNNDRYQPRDNNRYQARDNNDRYQPRDNREGGYQPRDNNDRYQPRDSNNRYQPRDNNNRYQPRDNRDNFRREPGKFTPRGGPNNYQPNNRFQGKGKPVKPWQKEDNIKIVSDLQVTDGKLKGKYLLTNPSPKVQPTGRRLREIMFRVLFRRIRAGRVLDLCAGAGTIGIEAISRGAMTGTFVERSAKMCSLIRKNLEALEIKPGHGEVIEMEVLPYLMKMSKRRRYWDVVYFDPPQDSNYDEIIAFLGRGTTIKPRGVLVVEHHAEMFLPEKSGSLNRWRVIVQGDKAVSFYERR